MLKIVVTSEFKADFNPANPHAMYCVGAAQDQKKLDRMLKDARRWFVSNEVWFYGIIEVEFDGCQLITKTVSFEKKEPFQLVEINKEAKKEPKKASDVLSHTMSMTQFISTFSTAPAEWVQAPVDPEQFNF